MQQLKLLSVGLLLSIEFEHKILGSSLEASINFIDSVKLAHLVFVDFGGLVGVQPFDGVIAGLGDGLLIAVGDLILEERVTRFSILSQDWRFINSFCNFCHQIL